MIPKSKIVENMFFLTVTVMVTIVCVGLYREVSGPDNKSMVFHSPNYKAITSQVAFSISADLSSGEIPEVKRKLSQFVSENRVSFIRVHDVNGLLIAEYYENNSPDDGVVKNKASENNLTNIVEVSSRISNGNKTVGRIDIGFPKYLNLVPVVQDGKSKSVNTLKNIIFVSVFSFVLGVYLANIYLKIKVRLAKYDSRILNRTIEIN